MSRPALLAMCAVIFAQAAARSAEQPGTSGRAPAEPDAKQPGTSGRAPAEPDAKQPGTSGQTPSRVRPALTGVEDEAYSRAVADLAVGDAASDLPPRKAFAEANRTYRAAAEAKGEARKVLYREAARRYDGLARRRPNGYVLYNLGNARFRAGEVGGAIAAYRRAAELLPRHAAVRRNLALARDTAPGGRQGMVIEPHPAAAAFFFWHYGISLAEAEKLAVFFFLVLLGLLLMQSASQKPPSAAATAAPFFGRASHRRQHRRTVAVRRFAARRFKRRLRPAAMACGALALAMALSSASKLAWSSGRDAVVVAPEARVRSEPAGRAVELFTLREGAEVRLLGRSGEWTRILAGADRRGWVETRAVEALD